MSEQSRRETSEEVVIYTDGGASPNPGPGGWGAVLIDPKSGRTRELSGGEAETTNNRMELVAAIRSLESLERRCRVELHTDSQYLRRGITEWLPTWRRRGWKRKEGPILNLDLWKRLSEVAGQHDVDWHWVKGHAGHEHNERADELASAQIRRRRPSHPATDFVVVSKITCSRSEGAWAALVRGEEGEEVRTGRLSGTTPNQLDLHAATEILASLPPNSSVAFFTGSDYLRRGASQWLPAWRKRGWKTKEGQPVKNADAWRRLGVELGKRKVLWPEADEEILAEIKRLAPISKEALRGEA